MPHPPVFVSVTFVSTKAGNKPSISIDSPVDISEHLGDIRSNEFDQLKAKLGTIVEDPECELYFHKDSVHRYRLDESALPNGAVYGMKDRRKSGSEASTKLTASKLIPIQSASEFQKHLEDVSDVVYEKGGRRNRLQKVVAYKVELCVVLVREKEKKPTRSIVCSSSGADTTVVASISGSGGGLSGMKRKMPPPPFTFPASHICISLFAPIETQQKKNAVTTGVPAGKVNKEITYDLRPLIHNGGPDDASYDSSPSLGDEVQTNDENFIDTFTLSSFRKDLMELAVDKFPEEYALNKKSLGRKCKLFVQKQWNSSSWTEVATTEMFLRTVREQMMTKARLKNKSVQIRFSFGRAKAGLEFKDDQEFDGYTCKDFGDGLQFSQNEDPVSPFVRQVGSVKRDACWNKPARISELIVSLYKNNACKLYHGFLKEHGNSFFRIISADLSIRKDASFFLPSLNDPTNHTFTDELIDTHLLATFIRSHQNDIVGGPMPETGKYPPTNEAMMVTSPTLREWKVTQRHPPAQHQVTPSYPHPPYVTIQSSSSLSNNREGSDSDITAITFKADWDDDLEVSVLVEESISSNSMMELVMEEGGVFEDLGVSADTINSYKLLVQTQNGKKLTLKWNKFKKITVDRLIRINNIDKDYCIVLKRIAL